MPVPLFPCVYACAASVVLHERITCAQRAWTRGGSSEALDRCLCLSFLAVYACAASVALHERISCAQRAWDAWWPVMRL